jgi:hypothetical protein
LRYGCRDLGTVKSAIFNKNFVGVHSGNDYSGEKDSRAFTFESLGIRPGLLGVGLKGDAMSVEESEIRAVTRHGKDELIGDFFGALWRVQDDRVGFDFGDRRVKTGLNFTRLDTVLDIGFDPVFDVAVDFRAPVNHGDAGTAPVELESSDGG